MVILRALLYSMSVFIALSIIALVVAGIMKIIYDIVHKSEKKADPEKNVEAKVVSE